MLRVIVTDHTAAREVSKVRLGLALVPGFLFLLAFLASTWDRAIGFTLFDDAMISMAYARTLESTGELVWFPGADRVQGFTNPLWTLFMAFLHFAGLSGSWAALFVSMTSLFLILGVAYVAGWLTSDLTFGASWSSLASYLCAGFTPFIVPLAYWSVRGMEVGLVAFLTAGCLFVLISQFRLWGAGEIGSPRLFLLALLGSLGVLTRLDFAVVIAACGLFAFIFAPDNQSRTRVIFIAGLPVFFTLTVLFLFQGQYYGDLLTNTYRLKMEGFSLLGRIEVGLDSTNRFMPIWVLATLSTSLILFNTRVSWLRQSVLAISGVTFFVVLYSVWVGGDAWEQFGLANRYVSAVMPLVMVLVIAATVVIMNRPRLQMVWVAVGLAVLVSSGVGCRTVPYPPSFSCGGTIANMPTLVAGALLFFIALLMNQRRPESRTRAVFALVVAASVTFLLMGGVHLWSWVQSGAPNVAADAAISRDSLLLGEVLDSGAVIATSWAGAPGYYLDGPKIDLLGKSDPVIASMDAAIKDRFVPGHNKWDYAYSIGELRPDVVFTMWRPTAEDLANLELWGYQWLCFSDVTGAYFSAESNLVRWDALAECQR